MSAASHGAGPDRFLATEIPEVAPADARFHVLPVPYEKTVSYGAGTGKGPASIIAASGQLERWDGQSDPGAEGIYTWPAVDCSGKPEAVIAAIRFGFENLGLNRIHANHLARNPASGRVMEKAGLIREGVARQHTKKWGKHEDLILYGLLREDWLRKERG